MGCCATKRLEVHPIRQKTNPVINATTTTSDTDNLPEEEENQDFLDFVRNVKKVHNIRRYRSLWFNTDQDIRLNYPYQMETDYYNIECRVTKTDPQKAACYKFALIVPQFLLVSELGNKNEIFFYCKEKELVESDMKPALPLIFQIDQQKMDKNNRSCELSLNMNSIVDMNIRLQSKQAQNQ